MPAQGRTIGMVVTIMIIILGIIHLGVGIGITARYRQFSDVFRQSVGLAAFSIVIGLFGIAVGALSLMSVMQERPALSKLAAILSGILGIFATASFIAALAINSQAVTYVGTRLEYHIYTYVDLPNSNNIIDVIQTRYQCCGESSWLDWARVPLGVNTEGTAAAGTNTGTGTVVGTNTGTGTAVGTNTATGTAAGGTGAVAEVKRRRDLSLRSSPLVKAVRRRRQTTGGIVYGLPTYSLALPQSCCIAGDVSTANTIGGYCTFTAQNGTESFNIGGCIFPVADIAVAQVTGIGVISICMAILAFVLLPILMFMFPASFDPTNPNNKQGLSNELQQEQQNQYGGGYYMNNSDPNGFYNNNVPQNTAPANIFPVYTSYQ